MKIIENKCTGATLIEYQKQLTQVELLTKAMVYYITLITEITKVIEVV